MVSSVKISQSPSDEKALVGSFAPMTNESTPAVLTWFLRVSRLEGISFLLLLFIAMPLKYAMDMPLGVKYVGWAHGLLFMAYIALLVVVAFRLKWNELKVIFGFLASLLPFGPFLFERWLRNQKAA